MSHPGGRPVKYRSPEQMQVIIDQYFEDCLYNRRQAIRPDAEPRGTITDDLHPTVTGLGLVLGLTRQSLINYEVKPEFLDTIKKAKAQVEAYAEQRLFYPNAVGTIFNLKNNFHWKDKTEQELSGSIDVNQLSDEALNAKILELTGKAK